LQLDGSEFESLDSLKTITFKGILDSELRSKKVQKKLTPEEQRLIDLAKENNYSPEELDQLLELQE